MNTLLNLFNSLGVGLLATLCVLQWKAAHEENQTLAALEKTRTEQVSKIADQEKTIQGNSSDLDSFRDRLTKADAESEDLRKKLDEAVADRDRAAARRDQAAGEATELQTKIDTWKAAVADRDAAIKKANDDIAALSGQRNDAIGRLNDLTNRYNALVLAGESHK